jgi:hypothetical protein
VTEPNERLQSGESPDPDQPDDIALASFLKANAPPILEPGLEFEDQLMRAIARESPGMVSRQTRSRPKSRWNAAIAAFIGLGVGAIAIGLGQLSQRFTSPPPSAAELAQLESFLIGDWNETVRPSETVKEWNWLDVKLISASPATAFAQGVNPSLSNYSQP